MVWPTPAAFSSPWTTTKANTYIRDAFDSVRRYQRAIQTFSEHINATTTHSVLISHMNLCDTTPDEGTTLIIITELFNNGGGAGGIFLQHRDQGANNIGIGSANGFGWVSGTACIAQATVAANTNPGFDLAVWTNTSTQEFLVTNTVFVVPT